MDSISFQDKFENIKQYLKYFILIIPLIALIIILKSCGDESNRLEQEVKNATLNYIKNNNLTIVGEQYIELSDLGEIDGTEICSKASGAIVKNNNGEINVQPYLECGDYKSIIVENKSKYATLNGDTIMVLNVGEAFNDPLYYLKKEAEVVISGMVGNNPGIYTINYFVYVKNQLKETLIRKVIVVKNDKTLTISGIKDLERPNITLLGDKEIVLAIGQRYVEPGYLAVDYKDGKITRKVKVTPSTISTNKAGNYTITYSITNSRGQTALAVRKVAVVQLKAELNITLTSVSNEINNSSILNIKVTGDGFRELRLPNGETKYTPEYSYSVKNNGIYTFEVYDVYGNKSVKEIEVNNIDNISPVGTCEAILNFSTTKVTVNATDNKGISGYSYIIDDVKSEYLTVNSYKLDKAASKVSVNIKDIAGNESTISCQITDRKNSTDPAGVTTIISSKPKLEKPIAEALAKRGYTVDDLNQCIFKRVEEAGPGTRYGVVAAAYGLLDCMLDMTGTVLSYDHDAGKVHVDSKSGFDHCARNPDICNKIGVNTRWGKRGGTCKTDVCYYGLNCATFVRWSMCNGGMNLCFGGSAGASSMANVNFFPEADGVIVNRNSVKYYSGKDLTSYSAYDLVRMIQPGDIAFRERNTDTDGSSQHTFVIVGKDETGIYTANNGSYINKITYSSMLDGEFYYRILFLDNYYDNPNNRNNLYN